MRLRQARLRAFLVAWALGLAIARPSLAQNLNPGAAPLSASTVTPSISLRLGGDSLSTRVVVDLAAAPTRRILATYSGERQIVLTAPASSDASVDGQGRGLVLHWRMSPTAAGSQVVLDLAPGVMIQRRFLMPPSSAVAVWRYVLDLAPAGAQASTASSSVAPVKDPSATPTAGFQTLAYRKPVRQLSEPAAKGDGLQALADELASTPGQPGRTQPKPGAASNVPKPSPRTLLASAPSALTISNPTSETRQASERLPVGRQKIIVIDAGHGGHDTGAQSLVRNEKDINLAAAQALKARLERTGRYRVVMTRDSDVFIPLEERVQIARRAKADLFISLHSDSAGSDPTPHGASVYTLSDRGVTRVRDVMGPQDGILRAGDKRANLAVSQILLDLTQRNTRNRSAEFAGILLDHISGSVDLLPRSQRDANYFVLLAPDVPAVLMEMGFITNPSDELRLTDPDQRRRMMDRVGEAIDDYFAPHAQIATR